MSVAALQVPKRFELEAWRRRSDLRGQYLLRNRSQFPPSLALKSTHEAFDSFCVVIFDAGHIEAAVMQ